MTIKRWAVITLNEEMYETSVNIFNTQDAAKKYVAELLTGDCNGDLSEYEKCDGSYVSGHDDGDYFVQYTIQEVEIELPGSELYGAYVEKEHEYDVDDVQNQFYEEAVHPTSDEIDEMAYKLRHNIDHYGVDQDYALDGIVDEWYEKHDMEDNEDELGN